MNHGPIAGLDLPYSQVWNGQLARDHDIKSLHGAIPQRSNTVRKDQEFQERQNISNPYQAQAWRYMLPPFNPGTPLAESSPRVDTSPNEFSHVAEPVEAGQETPTDQLSSKSLPFPPRPNLVVAATNIIDVEHGKKSVLSVKRNVETIRSSDLRGTSRQEKDLFGSSSWTGIHVEDQLTDQVVKNGFSAKQQVLNESFSAKPTLLPHFKNTSGLQALGLLFTSVLQQKQRARRMQLPSTFKPPPRVTLTDTKREAWLRDLASPQVPLRRLSRTIPHGIRGKTLLDQCVAKKIPISRAMWLAKCVGANEIRASKRKGVVGAVTTSSELKWVKEWTSTLETFIEDNVEHCGAPGANLHYALQISVHFWQEGLLDRVQFIDWQLGYFEKCSFRQIPAVLILVRAYLSKLTADLRSIHRLTELCLQKMQILSSMRNSAMQPLLELLQRLVHNLITAHPAGIILESWEAFRPRLLQMASLTHQHTRIGYQAVIDRNDRLSFTNTSTLSPCLPSYRVFNALDKVYDWAPITPLSSYCRSHLSIEKGLLTALLQWAASDYRDGQHRPCLVVRIILEVSSTCDTDINRAILDALYILKDNLSVSSKIITGMLADLVELHVLDYSRYMRWLITVGALNIHSPQVISNRCDLQLLVEMPLENMSKDALHLQGSLLRRIGVIISDDIQKVSRIKCLIAASLPEIYWPGDPALVEFSHGELNALLKTSSIAVVSAIRAWIGDAVQKSVDEQSAGQILKGTINRSTLDITRSSFLKLRHVLEGFAAFTTLNDIMVSIISPKDHDLLHSIIDTLTLNFQVFAVNGAVHQVYQRLFYAYRELQPRTLLGKTGICSLIQLGTRIGVAAQVKQQLEQDLKLCDESIGLAAFTPMSDVMSDSMSCTDSEDEIERVLNSAGVPDAATTGRIFSMIMAYLKQGLRCDRSTQRYCSSMMTKLFRLNQEGTVRQLDEWMLTYFLNSSGIDLTPFFKELVSSQAINLEQLCACAKPNSFVTSLTDLKTIATKVLELVFSPPDSFENNNDDVECRFAIHQKAFCLAQSPLILDLMCQAVQRNVGSGINLAPTVLRNPILLSVIRKLLRQGSEPTWTQLDESGLCLIIQGSERLGSFVCDVIDPRGNIGYSKMSLDQTIQSLFLGVDALSLPFSQWALHVIANALSPNSTNCRDSIVRASYASLRRSCLLWGQLVLVVDAQLLRDIRVSVERDLISNYLGCDLEFNEEDVAAADTHAIQSRLDIVKVTMTNTSSQEGAEAESNDGALLESLKLHTASLETMVSNPPALKDQTRAYGIFKLEALLELSLIHVRSATFNAGENTFSIKLLGILCLLLSSATNILPKNFLQYIMDIMGSIITPLPLQSISRVIDDLPPQTRQNPRIKFLLGIQDQSDAWLHITQPVTTSTPKPGNSSRPDLAVQATKNSVPFPLRRWELLPDATVNVDANDTALSLSLFDARRL